jgi:hypothetical protein
MVSREVAVQAVARARAEKADGLGVTDVVDLGGALHVIGVTWPTGLLRRGDAVEVRERVGGSWGPWQQLGHDDDHAPDAGTAEASSARGGTDAWVSSAEAVQVRVLTSGHGLGRGARLDVVDPGRSAADVRSQVAGAASAQGAQPTILTRADWGADESIRHNIFGYGTIKAGIVHHTAGTNSYSAADVPAIIRGIYEFHTNGRGWGDIGYNFLIDRFGRTWEGRWGGVDKPVIGAQALGFNSQTYGAAVIGDYSSVTPPSAVVTAEARLAAWKLGLSYIDPTSTTTLDGAGTRPTIIGHRDVNSTGCPGDRLYAQLPQIRTLAKSYQGTVFYGPRISGTSMAYRGPGPTVTARASTAMTWRLLVTSPCHVGVLAVRTGTVAAGGTVSAAWDGRLDGGGYAPPGPYRLQLTGSNGSGTTATARPATYTVTVADASGAPAGFCPPRYGGATRYDVAVTAARAQDDTTRSVVLVGGRETTMADALVAAPLARHLGAVLLLTDADALSAATGAEITRRAATSVTIVGGAGSVGPAVVTRLQQLGVTTVHRIGGADRYEVAANVARAIAGGTSTPDAFVVSGDQAALADGLGLSGPAARLGRPVLLARAAEVPAVTGSALSDLGVQRTVAAGGPATLPDDVLTQLPSATRLGGATRFDVSVSVATWAAANGVGAADVLVSSGRTAALADTLSGGQLGRITLYVDPSGVPVPVAAWLDDNTALTRAVVLGGESSVPPLVAGRVQQAVLQ